MFKNLYAHASAEVNANGNSGDLSTMLLEEVAVDVNVSALRGTSPTIQFAFERKGADGLYYGVWAPSAISAAGSQSTSIGRGAVTNAELEAAGRLKWTLGGTAVATTVPTGAASATQTLASASGMAVGDTLHFATANANRTITAINGNAVTLNSSVTTVDTEAVTDTSTPAVTFTASVGGK